MFDGFGKTNTLEYLNKLESHMIVQLLKKHYEVEISDTPDYIFYNVNGTEYYKYDGIRIFCTVEAVCPDFNLADYGIGFEYLEYGDRYLRFPNFYFTPDKTSQMVEKHKQIVPWLAERDFCSFVYSNANADTIRSELFEQLSRYKKVNSGGRYLNNLPDGQPVADKLEFEKKHKFSIACENASHPGYHTEKLAEAFAARTVPIYWGDPEIEKIFNPSAFINCRAYPSVEAVVERIKYLDSHPDVYLEMLKEPALLSYPEVGSEFAEQKVKELEDFLTHIIEQPLEVAFRRNRGFWGRQYLQEKRSVGSVLERYNRLRNVGIARVIRKLKNK